MADFVQIVVKVDKSQLESLQSAVQQLNGQTVKIDVDTGSLDAVQRKLEKTIDTVRSDGTEQHIRQINTGLGETVKITQDLGAKGTKVTQTRTKDFKEVDRVQREVNKSLMEMDAQERKLAASMPKTPMQQRIDDMLGIGRETKSAAESAKFFEKELAKEAGRFHEVEKTSKGAAEGNKKVGDSAEQSAKKTRGLMATLNQYVNWYLRWTIVSNIFNAAIRSITQAINTMKEVDQELTNIKKVSDLTATEISRIGEAAYATASKYGVGVKEYLSAVYEFQKAGLGDSAEKLGELATKTMLVGDTTAEMADKFLIAVNAAWDYGGSMEKLSIAVDQADFINNKYATTLAKLTEGMPIVASTAAQMGMSFEETIALLGTINSKTQETGKKTATAVRSFLIAVAKQVGEFVDEEGETFEVTTENIEALTDALIKYGSESVRSAAQSGEIINPMEALSSLAQAYKDGLLDDIELTNILIQVGGKMRYNSLVTIVKDLASETSTYRDMLENLGYAAGTADKEVATMLESWNAKTEILRNTWTQFISHTLDSRAFKRAIDALTAAIKFLDSGFGRFSVTLSLVAAAAKALTALFGALITKVKMAGAAAALGGVGWATFSAEEKAAIISSVTLGDALTVLAAKAKKSFAAFVASPLAPFVATAVGLYGTYKLIDALVVTAEEHAQNAVKLADEYKQVSSELGSLNERINENNEKIEEANELGGNTAYIKRLENENGLLQAQIDLLEEAARKKKEAAEKEGEAAWNANSYFIKTGERTVWTSQTQSHTTSDYRKGNIKEYAEQLLDMAEAGEDVDEELRKVFETLEIINGQTDAYADEIAALVKRYFELREQLNGIEKDEEAATDSGEKLTVKLKSQKEIYDEIALKAKAYTDALDEMAKSGGMTDDTMQKLIEAAPELESQLQLTANGWVINKQTLEDYLTALKQNYQTVYNNAATSATNIVNSEAAKAAGFKATTGSILEQIKALSALYGLKVTEARNAVLDEYGNDVIGRKIASTDPEVQRWSDLYYEASSAYTDLMTADKNRTTVEDILASIRGRNTGGGSTKTTEKAEDKAEEVKELTAEQRIANRINLRKSELSMMEKSGYAEADQIAKMREIQALIHERAEAIRATAEYQEAARIAAEDETQLTEEQVKLLQEVVDLGGEWNDYQSKIEKSIENTVKTTKDALKSALDAAKQSALDLVNAEKEAVIGPMQAQLDALKEEKDTIEDAREEEEKLLAVEKARVALANAQRERTVRIYNSATGRWENVADQNAINSAKEELKSAKDALSDYYRNRSITALEKNIETIQGDYDTLSDAITNFATAINDGSRNFTEAMTVLLEAASGTGLSGLAGQAASAFTTAGKDTILAQMIANGQAWGKADAAGKKYYEDLNYQLGTSQGWTRIEGAWYDQAGNRLYDSGGILRGLGGIKATRDDEMILPPKMTNAMLTAERNGSFDALLNHLGIVTSAAQGYAGYQGGIIAGGVGSQHNGDVYSINGITIGEAQARGMSVYDLAQYARTLSLHNA